MNIYIVLYCFILITRITPIQGWGAIPTRVELVEACKNGNIRFLEAAETAGVDIKSFPPERYGEYSSLLLVAISNQKDDITIWLNTRNYPLTISKGACIDLLTACVWSRPEIIESIIDRLASERKISNRAFTQAIDYALQVAKSLEAVRKSSVEAQLKQRRQLRHSSKNRKK